MIEPKKVLILGATSALAQATARLLARDGASLLLVGRNSAKIDSVKHDLTVYGAATISTVVQDLDDINSHDQLVTTANQTLGGIDIALIAYGSLGDQKTAESNFGEAHKIIHTNFVSCASLLTHLANYFEEQNHGSIVVISSVAGDRGRRSNYIYGSSKGALSIFVSGIRARLFGSGVHVLDVKPGFVDTPMTQHLESKPLCVSADKIARGIVKAIVKRKSVAYLPGIWRPIMFLIRMLPQVIFLRLPI